MGPMALIFAASPDVAIFNGRVSHVAGIFPGRNPVGRED